jgi:RND family efflux transporter MFP subunit
MKKTLYSIIILGSLTLASCSSKEKQEPITNKTDSAIEVTIATPTSNNGNGLSLSGQVEAGQTVQISTRVMGYITYLKVKPGDRVSKGQLLVSISNEDILAKRAQADAMIAEAEAAVKNAKKDEDRFIALYKQQSASAKELDNINLQYSSAKARLDAAKQMRNEVSAMLAYTNLTAPFSGMVSQKMAEAGSMASPGMPILTIEEGGAFQISATVPENLISQVHQGVETNISIKAIAKNIKGTVVQINQSSQFTGGQYLIKIRLSSADQQGLYSGMYANVFIPIKNASQINNTTSAIMVPVSAITYKNQLAGLYTISSNNTALLRWVRLGKTTGNMVEVLTGLQKEESYISSAEGKLFNGAQVKTK